MRLLLTSGGVTNPSIRDALVRLLGRPVEECRALVVPTAQWGHPWCGPESALRGLVGGRPGSMVDLGWRSVGLLELTALASVGPERWEPWVREADALLVEGGDATYLAHWVRESGLADLLPSLRDTVWVGLSAGSMVTTPRIGDDFVEWRPPGWSDRTLGLVDFAIYPHVGPNPMDGADAWAAEVGCPAYAMDDETALVVVDGTVEVVSEGRWRHLPGPG